MRTFSKVLALALCVAMLFTTAFASGLNASYVDFVNGTDTITARVNLRNDGSVDATGKIIVASYDENGNLVATGESEKTTFTKGAEHIISATVASAGAASYKAFVWDDAFGINTIHSVKGAVSASDFKADTGVSDGMRSKNTVHTFKSSQTDGVLYTGLRGRTAADDSTETGGRLTTYNANSQQFHELTYVDESLQGYDYFVFVAGPYTYDDVKYPDGLLTFEVTRDSEVIIMTSNANLNFEGFDYVTPAEEAPVYAKARYMTTEFVKALQAIGVTVTYEIAEICNTYRNKISSADRENDGFYNEYLKAAYESASDSAKSTFDTNYNKFLDAKAHACTVTADYSALYSATYTVPEGEDSVSVHIPANTAKYINSKGQEVYHETRNLIVVVKPIANASTEGAFTPIASASSINAVPALKGVEINGAYVGIDKFVSNAYNYKLNPAGDCILPVVKGITTDNALYSSTDYDIAQDGKTAVATITVQNLYTGATPAVYTVNFAIDETMIPADAYDIVNLNGTTIVDDTNVLKEKTFVTEPGVSGECPIEAPVSKVSGMTYAEYIAYINEYYGYEEGDPNYVVGTGVVKDTDVVATNSYFRFANDFEIGSAAGTESNRRQVATINPKYAFYRDAYRLYGTISLGQGGSHGFNGGIFFGKDAAYLDAYNANAGTDKLPSVPWFTANVVKRGTVWVNSYKAMPQIIAKGYTLVSSTTAAYTAIDTNNNNANFATPAYIYYKVINPGETVEIFNDCNGTMGNIHPAAWFFSTYVPAETELIYGKKSSGVVATAFNSDLTDGVLYKDLFADSHTSDLTTGGRWVSDFHPLSSGQRIKSIEDPSIAGCEYFTFSINNRGKFGTFTDTNILEFKVDKDCEVIIATKSADSAAVFGDFVKNTNAPTLTGMFPQANFVETLKNVGIPTKDLSIEMIEDFYSNSKLTFKQIYDKWLSNYFPGATEEELLAAVNAAAKKTTIGKELFADVNSASAVSGNTGTHPYTVTYTKPFKAGDTVAIPDPTGKAGFDRPIVVIVKPRLNAVITDHVSDFQIVHANGEGSFILGPGAHAAGGVTGFSDRLVHCLSTEPGVASFASAYSINNQRIFRETDEILGLENCYYLKYVNQNSLDKVLGNTAKADWIGGADKEDLPWMTFTVNQDCDIIIVPSAETPKFVTRAANGWYKNTLSDYAFTLSRKTANGGGSYQNYDSNSQKVMYVKSFKAGDTVTLYNGNNGSYSLSYDRLPYFAFVRVK